MMNARLFRLVQSLSLAALVWFAYSLLHHLHPVLVLMPVLLAATNVTVMWMLRYDPERITWLFSQPYAGSYLRWICRLAGEQPPLTHAPGDRDSEFLLQSDADFRTASWQAKRVVFGHDEVVDQMLSRIRDSLALRKRRRDRGSQRPLGSFLFVGCEGIGKRNLARVMAKLLFRSGSVLAFECDKLASGTLLGGRGSSGELVEAVRQQPYQLVLLEHVDAAAPSVLEELRTVLMRGVCRDPSSGREVSFQNVIFVLTTIQAADRLAPISAKSLTERAWHEQAAEAVCSDSALDSAFVHAIGEIISCEPPTDYVKAQVTAQLMLKECQAHGLELVQADPLIVASEVLQIDDEIGFQRLPQNVQKRLAKPILTATQQNKKHSSLRVRVPGAQPAVKQP